MYFRHKLSKAVMQTSKSPGEEWDRIDGPESGEHAESSSPAVPAVPAPGKPKPASKS